MDTETDFNNNRRNCFANSDYGSEGGWNAYIPLAKTCLVDLMSPQECKGIDPLKSTKKIYTVYLYARHGLAVGLPFFPPYLICTISHHFH